MRSGFRGKTFWDILDVVVVPLLLAIFAAGLAFFFQRALADDAEDRATSRAQDDQRLAQERVREDRVLAAASERDAALSSYLQEMSELMLDHGLLESRGNGDVRSIARTTTLTVLRRLEGDGQKKGQVLRFLAEAGLISAANVRGTKAIDPKVVLRGADFGGASLANADLAHTVLIEADLSDADLRGAYMTQSRLDGIDLRDAHLDRARLDASHMSSAHLAGATFRDAVLFDVDLWGACLTDASFVSASLSNAQLRGAIGERIDFRKARLRGWKADGARLAAVMGLEPGPEQAELAAGDVPADWSTTGAVLTREDRRCDRDSPTSAESLTAPHD